MKIRIDYKRLKTVCNAPVDYFSQYGVVSYFENPYERIDLDESDEPMVIFCRDYNQRAKKQKMTGRILGIAHLDSVSDLTHFYHLRIRDENIVYNASLDDRLGVYVLLDLLNQFSDIQYDLLLTIGEESGDSSAQYFSPIEGESYNWMFSFDRHGIEVVSYQYDCKDLRQLVSHAGFKMGQGSFSDICFLDHLGVMGINVGTAYYNEHTDFHFANIDELLTQVYKFRKFYNQNKSIRLPYIPTPKTANPIRRLYFGDMGDDYSDRFLFERIRHANESRIDEDSLTCYNCDSPIDESYNHVLLVGKSKEPICHRCESEVLNCTICGELYLSWDLTNDGICDSCMRRIEIKL